jgi:hypothetical protein
MRSLIDIGGGLPPWSPEYLLILSPTFPSADTPLAIP